ncbi:MAG: hypothetical protein FWD86_02245 [Firmicutes bacterium]|nr:hypothetical protein [Bacillota bacterium]
MNNELKRRAMLAKQRMKMGYWQEVLRQKQEMIKRSNGAFESIRAIQAVQMAEIKRDASVIASGGVGGMGNGGSMANAIMGGSAGGVNFSGGVGGGAGLNFGGSNSNFSGAGSNFNGSNSSFNGTKSNPNGSNSSFSSALPKTTNSSLAGKYALAANSALAENEALYEKVKAILIKDEFASNPIGDLIDKVKFGSMDESARARYVLELGAKFRELKERFFKEQAVV